MWQRREQNGCFAPFRQRPPCISTRADYRFLSSVINSALFFVCDNVSGISHTAHPLDDSQFGNSIKKKPADAEFTTMSRLWLHSHSTPSNKVQNCIPFIIHSTDDCLFCCTRLSRAWIIVRKGALRGAEKAPWNVTPKNTKILMNCICVELTN